MVPYRIFNPYFSSNKTSYTRNVRTENAIKQPFRTPIGEKAPNQPSQMGWICYGTLLYPDSEFIILEDGFESDVKPIIWIQTHGKIKRWDSKSSFEPDYNSDLSFRFEFSFKFVLGSKSILALNLIPVIIKVVKCESSSSSSWKPFPHCVESRSESLDRNRVWFFTRSYNMFQIQIWFYIKLHCGAHMMIIDTV